MRWLALPLVAACGASNAPAIPPPPDASPAEVATDELELRAKRACGCTDHDCWIAVRDSLHDLDGVALPSAPRVTAAQKAIATCLQPIFDGEAMPLWEELNRVAQAMCACHDEDCARAQQRSLEVWKDGLDTLGEALLASNILLLDDLAWIASCASGAGLDA